MKLKLLLILFSGTVLFSNASAYEVPTEIQKKNILLEVFTGIHCGNCPDGDEFTDNLLTAQPEITYAIDVHAGHYAVPGATEPDYRVDEGETVDTEFNHYGYPGGAVNRRAYPEYEEQTSYVISRSAWAKKGKEIHQEDAPVNLWLKSVFDGNTRELKIRVEGYYTGDVEQTEHFLTVLITQDNIKGPQSGASQGNNYNHRHTLRAYLTPAWGEAIDSPKKGEYFTREYIYTLPADIRNVPLLAEDIEVIAFVSMDKTEVLNVTGGKPEYLHYDKPLSATLQVSKPAVSGRYGYNFFNAKLKNEYSQAITAAEFEVTVNGAKQTATWAGNMAAFDTQTIRIDVAPYTIENDNQYVIRLVSLNGMAVPGNTLTGSFVKPGESTTKVMVEIKTDLSAEDNIFAIKDADGKIVKEFGPYPTNTVAIYNETADLELNKIYCFEVVDLWGDGIGNPRGYYKVYKDDRTMIAQNYDIKTLGDKFFFRTTTQSQTGIGSPVGQSQTIASVNSDTKMLEVSFTATDIGVTDITIYSTTGQRLLNQSLATASGKSYQTAVPVSSLPAGIYLLNVYQKNKKETIKLFIY